MKKLLLLTILLPAVMPCLCSQSAMIAPAVPTNISTAVLDASYVVTSDVLEVRSAPGEKSLHEDYLKGGDAVTVFTTVKSAGEFCRSWARIGSGRWVCADHLEFQKYP